MHLSETIELLLGRSSINEFMSARKLIANSTRSPYCIRIPLPGRSPYSTVYVYVCTGYSSNSSPDKHCAELRLQDSVPSSFTDLSVQACKQPRRISRRVLRRGHALCCGTHSSTPPRCAMVGPTADITNRMKTPSGDGGEAQPEVTNAAAAASVWTRPLDGHHTGAIRSQLERCGYPWPLQDNEMLRRLINRLAGGTQGHYTKIVNAIGTPTLDALKKVMRAERDTHGRPVWERTKRERDSQSERAVAKRARCKRDSVSEQVIAEDLSAATLSRAHATGLIEAGGLSGAMMVLQVWNCLGGWSWKDKDLRLAFCATMRKRNRSSHVLAEYWVRQIC